MTLGSPTRTPLPMLASAYATGDSTTPAPDRGLVRNARLARVGFWFFALICLAYAPMGISYMWHYFVTGAPRLEDTVTSAIDGRSYARGYGSVEWLRAGDYLHNRWVMLGHTTFGGLSLIAGLLQFIPAVRSRWVALHRWAGRAFLLSMTASMLLAMSFLATAGPARFSLASALWLQLWTLSLSTLSTGWLGYYMIKRGQVAAHQAFMLLCFAYLMTAPALRFSWIALHPVFPHLALTQNLEISAVAEALLAPSLGVTAFILTRAPVEVAGEPPSRSAYFGSLATAAFGVALTLWHAAVTVPVSVPREILWGYLVPLIATLMACLGFAARARRASRYSEERRWRVLCFGVAATTIAINVTWAASAGIASPAEAFVSSLMVTTGIPIALAGIVIINDVCACSLTVRSNV